MSSKEYQSQYYTKNKTRLKHYKRVHYALNKDTYLENQRKYRARKKGGKVDGISSLGCR